MRSLLRILVITLVAASAPARAFLIGIPPPEITVYEYYNTIVNRYVLLNDPQEIAFVESGGAGPGWVRTQYAFQAYPANYNAQGFFASPVYRFYAPSVNSHFYTAQQNEYQILANPGSGWIFERIDFSALVPDTTGTCAANLFPVWRLYNNRFQFGDTDHRYTPDASVRDALVAQGWTNEGVNFCVTNYAIPTTETIKQAFRIDAFEMATNGQCFDPSRARPSCLDLENVAPMPNLIPKYLPPTFSTLNPNPQYSPQFDALTGYNLIGGLFTSESPGDTNSILADSFVQNPSSTPTDSIGDPSGIHVVAAKRTTGTSASINPSYTLPASGTGQVLPFADGQPHTLFLSIGTRPVTVRASSGSAQGAMAIRFVDTVSGGAIDLSVLAFGTGTATDSMTFDATNKVVQATTSFKDAPSFGHVYVGSYIQCNGAPCATADMGFAYGLDQTAFAQLVAAARAVNPALSADIRNYAISNFRFVNQATLDGEIGVKLWSYELLVYGLWFNPQ